MSKLKVEEFDNTTNNNTHHALLCQLNTAMMTDAGVNQSSGLGQAHSNNDRCWCKSKFWLGTGTQQ